MITVSIIVGYLFLLLLLGFLSARLFRGGATDYFIASRSIGPFVLLMSIFGTTMTAFAMIGSTGEAYRAGVGTYGKMASWSGLIHSACFFFVGMKLWTLGQRHGYMTQVEYFRDRFNSPLLGYLLFPVLVLLVIPYLLIGIMGAGNVMSGITRGAFPETFAATGGAVPAWLTGLVIAGVVLSYVFIGGVRSAAWANTFQTLVFMVMGLLAFILIAGELGGMKAASQAALPEKAYRQGNIPEMVFLTYCFIPLSVAMFPHLFQNCLTARSAKTFRLTLVAHPLFMLVTWVPCIFIGFWATGALLDHPAFASLSAPGGSNKVLGLMLNTYTGEIIVGLVTAGILAAIMSSLDSQFVCLGTMFTRDVVLRVAGPERFNERQLVWFARGFIVAIVVVTYLLTLLEPRSIFALGVWCFSGFGALFPLVFGALYWRRTTAAGAIASLVAASVTWVALFTASDYGANREFYPMGVMPVFFIFAACGVTLVVVSLLTPAPAPERLAKFFKVRPAAVAPSAEPVKTPA
ncbi:MAG: sodium:solute symporter [Opitutales bacterium]